MNSGSVSIRKYLFKIPGNDSISDWYWNGSTFARLRNNLISSLNFGNRDPNQKVVMEFDGYTLNSSVDVSPDVVSL
jgi:hypothetical protein